MGRKAVAMKRSKWSVVIRDDKRKIIWITDDDGSISVTNDAEHVVRDIHQRHPNYRVIYRDSQGQWDELVHSNGTLTGFVTSAERPPS